ncbi:hypothetical protein BGX20_001451 [Mortierella sp. AD010]|nr:hypothetical protein BGX20_001451 [Mortierella sp. AD010]
MFASFSLRPFLFPNHHRTQKHLGGSTMEMTRASVDVSPSMDIIIENQFNTVLTSLLTHELIPAHAFGVWLGNNDARSSSSSSTDPNAGDREFIFGSIDTSRLVKVDKNPDLAISGNTIIDSGTTLLVMPITQAKKVDRAIGATSGPCRSTGTLGPPLQLEFERTL